MRTSFLTTDWLPGVAMLKIAVALAVVLTALAARLHAQDSTLWRYTAEGEISFYRISPLGHLIVSEKNKLVALDPKSGEPAWTREDIQGLAREDFKIIPFMPLALVLS